MCWSIVSVLAVIMTLAACAGPGAGTPAVRMIDGVPTLTVAEAHRTWKLGGTQVLDVRTPGEYVFVGHVPGARNIPLKFQENRWDPQRQAPAMRSNPAFLTAVAQAYPKDTALLVICRSGKRSAEAVKLLRAQGFTGAVSVDGGFEGEFGKDCDCPAREKIIKKGWKTLGYEWVYAAEEPLIWHDPD